MAVAIIVLIILVAIIWWAVSKNGKPSVSISKNATTYYGNLKRDSVTKKAFVMYVMMSVVNLGEKWCQNIMDEGDDIKAKEAIEKAFDIITTDTCNHYVRKGMFNPYKGQELADENKVLLDLYESLIFGSNSAESNRIDLFSQEEQMKLLMAIHSIHNLLISDDKELAAGKKELADSFDQVFGEQDTKKEAGEVFEKYYNKMLPIINQSPFENETDSFELVCSMCVCSDYIATASKKDRFKTMESVQSVIDRLFPNIDKDKMNRRMVLYGEIIRGKPLRGEWYMKVGDINKDANDVITRIVALLGDALYNPNCIENYFSEEREIRVQGLLEDMAFLERVMNPLLDTMRQFANEL